LTVVLAIIAMAVPAVQAQQQQQRQRGQRGGGGPGGGGLLMLLNQKAVQEDLKLSEDQTKKVQELAQKQRDSFRDFQNLSQEERQKKGQEMAAANQKALAEILNADQMKRAKQLSLQERGARALGEEEVASSLNLSAEQKDKVKSILDDQRKQMGELFQPGGNREEAQKKMADLRKATDEKLSAVLSADQQAKWKEMSGEPFKGEFQRFGAGAGGGQRPQRQRQQQAPPQ